MAEGGKCPTCFVGTLTLDAGMLVCDVCGSIVHHFTQETQEYQVGVTNARRTRVFEGASQQGPKTVTEAEKADIAGGVSAYVQAVQRLLQKQIKAMGTLFGTAPTLMDVAQPIWMAYVCEIKVLERSFALALESKVEAKKPRSNQTTRKTERYSHMRVFVEDELQGVLPISTSLAILFLACWNSREAVNPLDITQAALNGELPYLEFATLFKDTLDPFQLVLTRALLIPAGVPGPSTLHFRSVEIAQKIQLRCPAINAGLWLRRYVDELDLPEELYPVALMLYNLYSPSMQENIELQASIPLHPWAALMAFVIIAIKFGCIIDGNVPSLKRVPSPSLAWIDWANKQFAKSQILSAFPLESGEILKGDPKLLFPFLEYIRNKFLSNFQPAEPLEEYQAALLRLANEHKSHLDGTQGRVEFIDPQPSQEALPSGRDHQRPSSANYQYVGKHSRIELTPLALEFAAILAVCSVRTWIAPDLLLDAVRNIETLLISTECQVAYDFDPKAQADLEYIKQHARNREQEQL